MNLVVAEHLSELTRPGFKAEPLTHLFEIHPICLLNDRRVSQHSVTIADDGLAVMESAKWMVIPQRPGGTMVANPVNGLLNIAHGIGLQGLRFNYGGVVQGNQILMVLPTQTP